MRKILQFDCFMITYWPHVAVWKTLRQILVYFTKFIWWYCNSTKCYKPAILQFDCFATLLAWLHTGLTWQPSRSSCEYMCILQSSCDIANTADVPKQLGKISLDFVLCRNVTGLAHEGGPMCKLARTASILIFLWGYHNFKWMLDWLRLIWICWETFNNL